MVPTLPTSVAHCCATGAPNRVGVVLVRVSSVLHSSHHHHHPALQIRQHWPPRCERVCGVGGPRQPRGLAGAALDSGVGGRRLALMGTSHSPRLLHSSPPPPSPSCPLSSSSSTSSSSSSPSLVAAVWLWPVVVFVRACCVYVCCVLCVVCCALCVVYSCLCLCGACRCYSRASWTSRALGRQHSTRSRSQATPRCALAFRASRRRATQTTTADWTQ
jgi:hypothetical protein